MPIANRIVVVDMLVEVFVRGEDAKREAPSFQEEVDELPLDLVEAFPDVGTASCNILPLSFASSKSRAVRYHASSAPVAAVVPA